MPHIQQNDMQIRIYDIYLQHLFYADQAWNVIFFLVRIAFNFLDVYFKSIFKNDIN